MSVSEFDPPDRFVADSIGPPGERTFFLQAAAGSRVMTVSLEKEQVAVLGERLGQLLDQVAGVEGSEAAAEGMVDNAPLDSPFEDDFRVQSLTVAWDSARRLVVIEAHEVIPPEIDPEADPDVASEATVEFDADQPPGQVLRVVLGPALARAFTRRCAQAVAGGRPQCPFCGQPLDPEGHICPRANGYRR